MFGDYHFPSILFISACSSSNTATLEALENLQSVGIGLYLALVIVQAISAGGVGGLQRRTATLSTAVAELDLQDEKSAVSRVKGDLGRLEISLQSIHRTAFWTVGVLLFLAIVFFGASALWPETPVSASLIFFLVGFELALPCLIFLVFARTIRKRCVNVETKIRAIEGRIKKAYFS